MTEGSTAISVATLNVNGLNTPVKIQKLAQWVKNMSQVHAIYKRITLIAKTQIKVKGWKMFCENSNQKRAEVPIIIRYIRLHIQY